MLALRYADMPDRSAQGRIRGGGGLGVCNPPPLDIHDFFNDNRGMGLLCLGKIKVSIYLLQLIMVLSLPVYLPWPYGSGTWLQMCL